MHLKYCWRFWLASNASAQNLEVYFDIDEINFVGVDLKKND